MKKLLAVLIVGMCVFAGVVHAETVNIKYMGFTSFGMEEKLKEMFEAQNPGITIEFVNAPEGGADRTHDKYVTMLAAGDDSIDVLNVDVIWPPELAAAGWLLPLDEWFPKEEQDKYIAAMIDAQTVDGHIYGVPWLADWGVLFYRKDILAEAGVEVPKTWQEMIDITTKLQNQPELIGWVSNWLADQQLMCEFVEYLYSNGGEFLDPTGKETRFNSPEGREAAQFMVDMANKYNVVEPGITTMNLDEGRAIFTEGKAIFHRNWLYVWAQAQYSEGTKVKDKVGIAVLPTFKEGKTTSTLGGWSWSVNKFTKHPEEAAKVALFLGGAEAQKLRAMEADRVPPYLPVLNDPDVVEKNPEYLEMYAMTKYIKSRPKSPFYTQMSNIMQAELQNAILQQKTVEEAFNDAEQEIQMILE